MRIVLLAVITVCLIAISAVSFHSFSLNYVLCKNIRFSESSLFDKNFVF
jgi:hypothetical protein